jgi:acetyl-CoA synthetase
MAAPQKPERGSEASEEVAEAAVVPGVDEIKWRMPEIYIALKPGVTTPHKEIAEKVTLTIETMIGKIARSKTV